jgi:cytochrome c biogenesis protein CcmG/thiol:disulfide interchange protein DsbE
LPSPSTPSWPDEASEASEREPRRLSRGALIALIVFAIAIPAVLLVVVLRDDSNDSMNDVVVPSPTKAKVGTLAPDFTLPALSGEDVTLSDLRGKPVVLAFFASWCNPCEKDMPVLQRLQDENPDDLYVIGVNFEDFRGDTEAFVERLGVTFPALIEDAAKNPVGKAYDVNAMPDTLFIDANGIVQERLYGQVSEKDIEGAVNNLLPPT